MRRFFFFILLILMTSLLGCSKHKIWVVSFNIRYDNPNDKENRWDLRKKDLVAQIQEFNLDFLGIQEGLHHQVTFLDENLPSHQFIGVGRDDGKQQGEYSAIFYNSQRFELIQTQTFWLSETPDVVSTGWDAALPRVFTYGHFKRKGSDDVIHVFNTHFDHRGNIAREKSAELILQKISDLNLDDEKVVLMGDFNAEPTDKPIEILSEKLMDGGKNSSLKGTFNGFQKDVIPSKRIDYIFTKNLRVVDYKHIDTKRPNGLWVSDHLAVYSKIEL